ncbi:MAG: imidazoleglycerol-phosphate dehydratase HisB [Balneolaceae bacterium]|nr:MAG: imidazoleglycerol-phosphate dehydratase HisB [Balneolaceae bacterium]
MNLQIEWSALRTDDPELLPEGALYALRTVQEAGWRLYSDSPELSARQNKLLINEGIELNTPGTEETVTLIRREIKLQLLHNGSLEAEADTWPDLCRKILFPERRAQIHRKTGETDIVLSLNLDGTGNSSIATGLRFFDHMLDQIARHGLIDLELSCKGDLDVDEHHTIEDCGIALGQAIRKAISENKAGIQRYGFVLPMDEAQATVAIDLSDRPHLRWEVDLKREYVGDFPTEMLKHFFYTVAMNAGATLYVKADGENEHHITEAVFKGFAKALRFSVSRNERIRGILPTTKGLI